MMELYWPQSDTQTTCTIKTVFYFNLFLQQLITLKTQQYTLIKAKRKKNVLFQFCPGKPYVKRTRKA